MTERPNVVLVTVDSLRADHCSFMGSRAVETPTLDELAADGAAFTAAVAPGPSTPESMPAIFTGRYPVDAVDPTDVAEARTLIGRHMATRETLAERLSARGYATAGFTPNPYTSRFFGFDAGFDQFEDFTDASLRTAGDGVLQRLSPTSDTAQAARMLFNLVQREEVFKPWEAFYDDVVAWMHRAERPYFLWVHLMDPHIPYVAPAPYRRMSWLQTVRTNAAFWRGDKEAGLDSATMGRLRTAYADTVQYTDAFLGRLRAVTDPNTAVVVHADHGEAFGEHGSYGHEPYLYEENVHVPFVVAGVPSATIADPVSLRALPSLVTDLADGEWDPDAATSAFALSRTARGERTALRGRRLKYIQSPSGPELYDLRAGEQDPLADASLHAICEAQLGRFEDGEMEARTLRRAVERLPEASV